MSLPLSKNSQSRLIDIALKFVAGAIRIVPRCLMGLFLKAVIPIVYWVTKKSNRICKMNFQLIYGDSEDNKKYEVMTKKYIKSIGYAMMDLLYYVDRQDKLLKITTVENEDYLKKALRSGRGVIAVSAHFGNFPLMFVSLVQKGYKVNVVIRSMRDKNFSEFMHRLCAKGGIRMIPTTPGKQFLKESLGALQRNELLFILLDEAVSHQKGVKVRFFNREVIRATGPFLFLERTSAPILPMFMVQDEKKHFKIIIERPLEIDKQSNTQENMEKNIAAFNGILESFVSRYPFQWGGWFNKKWAIGPKSS